MPKVLTYLRYLSDYLKHGDFISVLAAFKYILTGTSHKKDRIITTSIGMFFCRKNTNDFQFANYYYEWGVKKFILDHLSEFDVFIDGGACIGEYSILLSKKNIRCFAFKPVRSNFKALLKNLKLNKVEKEVVACPFGLSDSNSTVNFDYNPVNTGASHIADRLNPEGLLSELRTFDSLLPGLNIFPEDRILFKLDVEGMETNAIEGSAGFIKSHPNLMFILEHKHSGQGRIRKALNEKAGFKYGIVDEFNFYARKVNNINESEKV